MKRILLCAGSLLVSLCVGSCALCSGALVEQRSWRDSGAERKLRVALTKPKVECRVGASSLEDEIELLAPLLFLQHGFPTVGTDQVADYIVDISAIEREIAGGWRPSRSITLDLRVRTNDGKRIAVPGSTPLAAARIISSSGDASLLSSADLTRLLSDAVRLLVSELARLRPKTRR